MTAGLGGVVGDPPERPPPEVRRRRATRGGDHTRGRKGIGNRFLVEKLANWVAVLEILPKMECSDKSATKTPGKKNRNGPNCAAPLKAVTTHTEAG